MSVSLPRSEAIGSCRITVTMTSKPVPSRLIGSFPGSDAALLSLTTVGGRSPLDVVPVPGATMGFVLTVDEVKVDRRRAVPSLHNWSD